MATVPTPRTWALNEDAASSTLNSGIRDPLLFLQKPPVAELRRNTTQSIANATGVAIQLNVDIIDTDMDGVGGHDPVTNNTRYTARYAGTYTFSGGNGWVANATGRRGSWWAVNGTNVNGSAAMVQATTSSTTSVAARTFSVFLNVGDFVELFGYQESGGALNVSGTTFEQASMSVRYASTIS